MVKPPYELHSKPARAATLLEFLSCNFMPLLITVLLYAFGLPGAILEQLRHPNPLNLINPFRWKTLIFNHGFGKVLAGSDQAWAPFKKPLLCTAYGKVLEIGAGAGHSVVHYDADKIDRLFCLEPYEPLRVQLTQKLAKHGLAAKSTVIPATLDQRSAILQAGIEPNSLDTIVLFQVLCSIPNPKDHLEFLQQLLKPGGQILLFEHVGSKHRLARTIQNIWTPVWRFNFGGCEMNRDSGDWLKAVGGWKVVDLKRPVQETSADLIPHDIGRLVKA